jgi:hypothetical protein
MRAHSIGVGSAGDLRERVRDALHQPDADRLGDEVHGEEGAAGGGAGARRAAAAANFAGAVRQPEHRVIAGALNNRGRFE